MSEGEQKAADGAGGAAPGAAQPPLAQHDSSILDLAFAMDCTGSMASYIRSAQNSIRKIVEEIVAAEKSDIHLALVEYRDHPPQDSTFVTRVHDFTPSVSRMKKDLDACSASGGGDTPEAVADALHQVSKLSWRKEATKICVFIADAPPHGLGECADGFPNGCPDNLDPMEITQTLAQMGVTLYMVGCEPSIRMYKDFFMALAHTTGGQYVPLGNAELLSKVIIGGAQEEISLERLITEAEAEVEEDVMAAGGWDAVGEDYLSRRVMDKMNSKSGGVRVQQLRLKSQALPQATGKAKKWAGYNKLSDVRKEYVEDLPTRERPSAPSSLRCDSDFAGSGTRPKKKSRSFLGALFGGRSSPPGPPVTFASTASFDSDEMDGVAETDVAADSYEVAEKECLDMAQASRMVTKMKNKHK